MWIYTTQGYYSVVELNTDDTKLLVRGRIKEDLDRLADWLELPLDAVKEDKMADYHWRLGADGSVSKEDFAAFLAEAVMNLDYTSHCKEEMSKPEGKREADRYGWYLDAWTAGMRVQSERLGENRGRYDTTLFGGGAPVATHAWTEDDLAWEQGYDDVPRKPLDYDEPEIDINDLQPNEADLLEVHDPDFDEWCADAGLEPNFKSFQIYIGEDDDE